MLEKPSNNEEWQEFCNKWDSASHPLKLELAQAYGKSYDSLRHWRSDCGIPVKQKNQSQPVMRVSMAELLEMRPAVKLDFVSFDLETSNLNADFSVLLSAVIKPFGQEPIVFRADNYPEWTSNRADDHRIVTDIANELKKHAVIITHYGMYFDVPFLRAKMAKHGLEPLPQMFAIDTWAIAKKNFKVSSRRLQRLVEFFDIGDKGQVEGELWMEAAYSGSKKAMDEIVAHNIVDCEVLEKLASIAFPYLKSIPKL